MSNSPLKYVLFAGDKFGLYQSRRVGRNQEKLDSAWYLDLLENTCIPELEQLNHQHPGTLINMHWQQDGASIHVTDEIMDFLDFYFANRVISRRRIRGILWPARSPDLNPCDYFLWYENVSQILIG